MRLLKTLAAAIVVPFLGGLLAAAPPAVTQKPFGTLPDGRAATLYTLTNAHGAQVEITNYGGVVVGLRVPDRNGKLGDVVLGYDNVGGYVADFTGPNADYFGALIGRYGNRIANGKFSLDGKSYQLYINNPPNSLHGGKVGFNQKMWKVRVVPGSTPALELSYVSPNGEENYPGTLTVHVTYRWTNDDALHIDYRATTDKDTVLNLTNHAYFNLSGEGSGSMLNTVLTLYAHHYTPINANLIPTGEIAPVAGTPMDFTKPTAIGARINDNNQQLKYAGGYDFNYVLDAGMPATPALAAEAYDPASGRVMRVYTTQPGIQFYTGNFMNGEHGKHGHIYHRRDAFTLETQHYPDSPNQPKFPTTELKPGQTYKESAVYQFSVRK